MLPDSVSRVEIAAVLGVDPRSVDNYVTEAMPKVGRGRYPLVGCVQWFVERERAAARSSRGLNDLDLARQRKTVADAARAELELAKEQGQVITADAHAAVVESVCDRLRAVLVNVPGNYGLRLERLGIAAGEAEALLEAIATELTGALRVVADDLEAVVDGDDSNAPR